MENMGIYFNEPQKKQRWESGQAILHREASESKDKKQQQKTSESKELKQPETIKNSYGKLNYLHHGRKNGQEQHGFSLEAFEAPGTPLHTEKEKHLNPASMKKIRRNGNQTLFASEVPLHNQALFYDMSDSKKSVRFLKYMKLLLKTQGHQTLQDAFGFLDQESEHRELEVLKKTSGELSPEEFQWKNQSMNTLNSRLQRKQSRERQLCKDLQLLLDQRCEQERTAAGRPLQKAAETTPESKEKRRADNFPKRHFASVSEDAAVSSSDTFPAASEAPPEEQDSPAKTK